MVKRFRRMSDSDITTIVADLTVGRSASLVQNSAGLCSKNVLALVVSHSKPSLKLKPLMTMPNKHCRVVS